MRRIVLWVASTIAGVVLLFSYRPNTATPSAAPTAAATTATATATDTPTSAGATAEADNSASYDGSLVQTSQGPVQVRITVSSGKIADVTSLVYPDSDRRHQEISSYALPILREDALQAQSADIDTVSGATATSEGYRESLQAAIDAAHL